MLQTANLSAIQGCVNQFLKSLTAPIEGAVNESIYEKHLDFDSPQNRAMNHFPMGNSALLACIRCFLEHRLGRPSHNQLLAIAVTFFPVNQF